MNIDNSNEIKVSVIMPVYNAEKYLETALDAVVNQTLKDIEIICVDDGSTDSSYGILKKYAERDKRFILLQQENRYAGIARNYGMSIARGEYLSFLDADDYFKPNMLEDAYQCGMREQADVVVFGADVFSKDLNDCVHDDCWMNEKMIPMTDSFHRERNEKYLLNFSGTAAWNKLFKRTFIERQNLFFSEQKRWEDVRFVVMALALADRIGIVRKNLLSYHRFNSDSLMGRKAENILEFPEAFYQIYLEFMNRKLSETLLNSLRNECLRQLGGNLRDIGTFQCFKELYNAFRDKYFDRLHITSMKEEDFADSCIYDEFCFVRDHMASEYVFQRYGELREITSCPPKEYIFPFDKINMNSKIILYGAGLVGHAYYRQIRNTEYCTVDAWVDNRAERFQNPRIISVEKIRQHDADYIVIAIEDKGIVETVIEELIKEYRIGQEKIIWRNPVLSRNL